VTFTDPDAYAALRDVQAAGVVNGRGDFRAESTTIRLDRLSLQRARETLPRITYSAFDPKQFSIAFVTLPGRQIYINGLELSPGYYPRDRLRYVVTTPNHQQVQGVCEGNSMSTPVCLANAA
jgi:hypothetical protein